MFNFNLNGERERDGQSAIGNYIGIRLNTCHFVALGWSFLTHSELRLASPDQCTTVLGHDPPLRAK